MKINKVSALEKWRQGLNFISAYKFGEPEYQMERFMLSKGLTDDQRCMEEDTLLNSKIRPVYLFSILHLSTYFIR